MASKLIIWTEEVKALARAFLEEHPKAEVIVVIQTQLAIPRKYQHTLAFNAFERLNRVYGRFLHYPGPLLPEVKVDWPKAEARESTLFWTSTMPMPKIFDRNGQSQHDVLRELAFSEAGSYRISDWPWQRRVFLKLSL